MVITLQGRNTITIPRELREALDLAPGSVLEARVEQGRLVLTPVAVVPRTLALTESGERKEAAAEADIRRGRVRQLDRVEELLEDGRE